MNSKTITGIALLVVGIILLAIYLPNFMANYNKLGSARGFGSRLQNRVYQKSVEEKAPVVGVGSVIIVGGVIFIILGARSRKKKD